MNNSTATRIAALIGFLAVALGALGAHALESRLEQNGLMATWKTGALYHAVHAVVLLVLAQRATVSRLPFILFCVGILLFSGSLYALAISNIRILGVITPFGGLSLLAGWLVLAIRPSRS